MLQLPLTGSELIPDLVRAWPATRSVLDRYGLHCCGGPYGPAESLKYFARAHAVDLPRLLTEIEAAVALGASGASTSADPEAVDPTGTIYRRFFLAGIAATLSAGAVWGAYLLLQLGFRGGFDAISPHDVNAHGHAQIFGWVGLFVMGFAYQAFPRFKHSRLRRPRLALATFPIYVSGLVLRTAGEAMHPSAPFFWAGLGGAALETGAVAVFAWIVAETLLAPEPKPRATDRYILAATGWFVVQAAYDAALFVLTSTARSPEELVERIATFQPPLRDMQIHGFALLMILGVSQRYLPGMLGLGRVRDALADVLLVGIHLAVTGEVLGHVAKRFSTGQYSPFSPWLIEASVLVLTGAAATLAWTFGVFHRPAEPERSVKFVRAAYAWLFVSLVLLALEPLYSGYAGRGFSHAYSGASRHAITVGFVSLMIVGVASKVVPTLNGVPAAVLPRLWVPFLLLNAGCALRVSFQILSDWTPEAFPVAGVSGVLEVAGLFLWSVHIARVLQGRYRFAAEVETRDGAPLEARPEHFVGWLTQVAPETIPVFERMGFQAISNRFLRETLARTVTIRQASRLRGVDEAELLARLNEVLEERRPPVRADAVPVEFVGRIAQRAT